MKRYLYKKVTQGIARTLRTPPYLILFLSNSCWMKCAHCWFNEDWKERWLTEPTLSFDELEKMADSMGRLIFLSLTGGEAFARKDIVEIAAMFARKTKLHRYQIPTSGYKPELIVGKAEQMLERNRGIPFRVDVSLDGTEQTHDRVRRIKGGYARVLETVRALNKLKRHYDYFDVGIITTVSSYNEQEIEDIAQVVRDSNPGGEWMVNIIRGEVRDEQASEIGLTGYIQAHRLIQQRIKQGDYSGHSGHKSAQWLSAKNAARREIIIRTVQGRCAGGGCAAGSLAGVIYADGNVKPCEMLDDSLGNIRDYDFDFAALWNSAPADLIRDRIQDTHCQCTQECFLSVSMLIQAQHWPAIVRERLRLISGGAFARLHRERDL